MKVTSAYGDGCLTMRLTGELDHHVARKVMSDIEVLLDEYIPRDCVLDMGGLTFMDSSGIAVILKVHRHMRETGGRVWVMNPKSQPLKVLDASGIDRLINIKQA